MKKIIVEIEYSSGAIFVKDPLGEILCQYTSQGVDNMTMRSFVDHMLMEFYGKVEGEFKIVRV